MTGKISDQTYEEWNRSTGRKELPERVHPKGSKGTKRSASKTKAASKTKPRKR